MRAVMDSATCATTRNLPSRRARGQRAWPAQMDGLPRGQTGGGKRRQQTTAEQRKSGNGGDEQDDVVRQSGIQQDRFAPSGKKCHQQGVSPPSRQKACRRPDNRQQRAFGDKLADQAPPACAERQPDGRFALPGNAAGEQKIGDVAASNEKNEAYKQHRDPHRQGILFPDT